MARAREKVVRATPRASVVAARFPGTLGLVVLLNIRRHVTWAWHEVAFSPGEARALGRALLRAAGPARRKGRSP